MAVAVTEKKQKINPDLAITFPCEMMELILLCFPCWNVQSKSSYKKSRVTDVLLQKSGPIYNI